eukprot:366230-Chlamydomonas_euryale.AAC.26
MVDVGVWGCGGLIRQETESYLRVRPLILRPCEPQHWQPPGAIPARFHPPHFQTFHTLLCRDDLIKALNNLYERRSEFDHVVIETTGLANPAPIISSFYMVGRRRILVCRVVFLHVSGGGGGGEDVFSVASKNVHISSITLSSIGSNSALHRSVAIAVLKRGAVWTWLGETAGLRQHPGTRGGNEPEGCLDGARPPAIIAATHFPLPIAPTTRMCTRIAACPPRHLPHTLDSLLFTLAFPDHKHTHTHTKKCVRACGENLQRTCREPVDNLQRTSPDLFPIARPYLRKRTKSSNNKKHDVHVHARLQDENLPSRVRLDGVVTLVDAKHVVHHLGEKKDDDVVNEAVEQIAYADRVLLNKVSGCGGCEQRGEGQGGGGGCEECMGCGGVRWGGEGGREDMGRDAAFTEHAQ